MDKYSEEHAFSGVNFRLERIPPMEPGTKAIDVHRNKIKMLQFSYPGEIEYLDISDNLVEDISGLGTLESVRVLDCSYNLIKEIPRLNLPCLLELYIIANDISVMANISFPNLLKLDIASNSIKEIGALNTPALGELYLASNEIAEVSGLSNLKELRILDLQYNKLSVLDFTLLPLSLEILLLQGNSGLKELLNIEYLENLKIIGLKGTAVKGVNFKAGVEVWY